MLPRAVFDPLKRAHSAACDPLPVTIGMCVQPACATAAEQERPSVTTLLPAAKSRGQVSIFPLAEALDDGELEPPGLALGRRLDRRHERGLAGRTPTALAARARPAEIGVVDLDPPFELALRGLARLHRRHQLVLDQPGGRLPRAEPARQLHRRHPALALGQVVDGQKPGGQRQLGPVEQVPAVRPTWRLQRLHW